MGARASQGSRELRSLPGGPQPCVALGVCPAAGRVVFSGPMCHFLGAWIYPVTNLAAETTRAPPAVLEAASLKSGFGRKSLLSSCSCWARPLPPAGGGFTLTSASVFSWPSVPAHSVSYRTLSLDLGHPPGWLPLRVSQGGPLVQFWLVLSFGGHHAGHYPQHWEARTCHIKNPDFGSPQGVRSRFSPWVVTGAGQRTPLEGAWFVIPCCPRLWGWGSGAACLLSLACRGWEWAQW